jgi:chromosomal replication initiator protein
MFEQLLAASQTAIDDVDTYLPLDENQLGRAAVTRLHASRRATISGSITLIHGPSGIGKTHLALSTLKDLARRHSRLKFAIASIQELCELMQAADENRSLAEFLEQCQSLDVLVCEDLTWLTDAPFFQPLFVMLIETLERGLTQVLITSQKPPGELHPLDQRLVSRCHGGLCVRLPMLSLDSRVQFLQQLFQSRRLPILKPFAAAARYLAERLPVTPRELHQAVSELARLQIQHPTPIDVPYLERWLAEGTRTPRLSFDAIVLQVANEFGVAASDLRSRSRHHGLSIPRQCAMWLARELTGRPLDQIGQYFDRSHTTVSHSLSRLKELLPSAPSLRQQVQKLRMQLNELPREDCA